MSEPKRAANDNRGSLAIVRLPTALDEERATHVARVVARVLVAQTLRELGIRGRRAS